uniref:Uncharacterized protein n=1 Tax=Romanomermis culicivorax TaxID=13658 RepID=A0A915JLB9_ROMCU
MISTTKHMGQTLEQLSMIGKMLQKLTEIADGSKETGDVGDQLQDWHIADCIEALQVGFDAGPGHQVS